ncbi:hypothetical protein MRX96_040827 [Rhipicephalus microplus]
MNAGSARHGGRLRCRLLSFSNVGEPGDSFLFFRCGPRPALLAATTPKCATDRGHCEVSTAVIKCLRAAPYSEETRKITTPRKPSVYASHITHAEFQLPSTSPTQQSARTLYMLRCFTGARDHHCWTLLMRSLVR